MRKSHPAECKWSGFSDPLMLALTAPIARNTRGQVLMQALAVHHPQGVQMASDCPSLISRSSLELSSQTSQLDAAASSMSIVLLSQDRL
jgi:hypothetical protein